MQKIEKSVFKALLILDVLAILISMVAGPLDYIFISIGSSVSAIIISIALLGYALYFWNEKAFKK